MSLHAFSVVMLILIQSLDQSICCFSSCCKFNTQRTLLNVDDHDEKIFFREHKEENIVEMQLQRDRTENEFPSIESPISSTG